MKSFARFSLLIPLIFAHLSFGSTIYSNFGPGDTYVNDSGVAVDQKPSFEFTSSVDQLLTEVDFVASLLSDQSENLLTVTLSADSGGHPGGALASQLFANQLGVLGGSSAISSWVLDTPVALSAGDSFWISLSATSGNVAWNYNDQRQFGYSVFNGATWSTTTNTLGALRLIGTSAGGNAPEPSSIGLFTVGIGCFWIGSRRRRLSFRKLRD